MNRIITNMTVSIITYQQHLILKYQDNNDSTSRIHWSM